MAASTHVRPLQKKMIFRLEHGTRKSRFGQFAWGSCVCFLFFFFLLPSLGGRKTVALSFNKTTTDPCRYIQVCPSLPAFGLVLELPPIDPPNSPVPPHSLASPCPSALSCPFRLTDQNCNTLHIPAPCSCLQLPPPSPPVPVLRSDSQVMALPLPEAVSTCFPICVLNAAPLCPPSSPASTCLSCLCALCCCHPLP